MPDLKEKRTEVLAPYELEAHHLTDHLFPNDQATNDKSDFLEGKLNVPDDRNSSEDIHIGPGCDGMCSPECDACYKASIDAADTFGQTCDGSCYETFGHECNFCKQAADQAADDRVLEQGY